MKSGLFLDVVVGKGATVFELLSSKDKSLLIRWDSLFVLNLCFDVINSIAGFDLKGDGLAGDYGCSQQMRRWRGRRAGWINLRVFTKICMIAETE